MTPRPITSDTFACPDDWSVLEAVGEDAATFLNGFCTNDVLKLSDGENCEAFFTDPKARVLAFGWVCRTADGCRVLLSSPGANALLEHLDRYVLNAKVELSAPEGTSVLLAGGPEQANIAAAPLTAYGEGVFAYVSSQESIEALQRDLTEQGRSLIDREELEQLRILQGVPRDGVDVDQRNLPQEVDRNETAINFTKGCYLGQEPVARIDAMGSVQWLLRGLRAAEGALKPGEEIAHEGKVVARVTSATTIGAESFALAYVRKLLATPGSMIEREGGSAEVCALPFEKLEA